MYDYFEKQYSVKSSVFVWCWPWYFGWVYPHNFFITAYVQLAASLAVWRDVHSNAHFTHRAAKSDNCGFMTLHRHGKRILRYHKVCRWTIRLSGVTLVLGEREINKNFYKRKETKIIHISEGETVTSSVLIYMLQLSSRCTWTNLSIARCEYLHADCGNKKSLIKEHVINYKFGTVHCLWTYKCQSTKKSVLIDGKVC